MMLSINNNKSIYILYAYNINHSFIHSYTHSSLSSFTRNKPARIILLMLLLLLMMMMNGDDNSHTLIHIILQCCSRNCLIRTLTLSHSLLQFKFNCIENKRIS